MEKLAPELQKTHDELTERVTRLVSGLDTHGVGIEVTAGLASDGIWANVKLDGEGWLSMCEMLLTFLEGKQRILNQLRAGEIPQVPGPEGFQ